VGTTGFEPKTFSFKARCLDHTTSEAVENSAVIFGQYKIFELLLENSIFISRRLKKQIGENVVKVPCALKLQQYM
jgi:hypothetical protein